MNPLEEIHRNPVIFLAMKVVDPRQSIYQGKSDIDNLLPLNCKLQELHYASAIVDKVFVRWLHPRITVVIPVETPNMLPQSADHVKYVTKYPTANINWKPFPISLVPDNMGLFPSQ